MNQNPGPKSYGVIWTGLVPLKSSDSKSIGSSPVSIWKKAIWRLIPHFQTQIQIPKSILHVLNQLKKITISCCFKTQVASQKATRRDNEEVKVLVVIWRINRWFRNMCYLEKLETWWDMHMHVQEKHVYIFIIFDFTTTLYHQIPATQHVSGEKISSFLGVVTIVNMSSKSDRHNHWPQLRGYYSQLFNLRITDFHDSQCREMAIGGYKPLKPIVKTMANNGISHFHIYICV